MSGDRIALMENLAVAPLDDMTICASCGILIAGPHLEVDADLDGRRCHLAVCEACLLKFAPQTHAFLDQPDDGRY